MMAVPNQIAQPAPLPRKRPQITWRQKSAVFLFTITVPILATNYWQHGGRITLFGVVPMPTLFLIACSGGAVSFFLWAQPRDRWFAAIPGAISGLGGFGAHLLYTQWFEHESLQSIESILIAAIGAAPGLLMFWAVARIGKAKVAAGVPPALALALLLSACTREHGSDDWLIGSAVSVLHGQVDFVSLPLLEWSFGSYNSLMCFDRSTVIRMGGTYVIVEAPYYVLLAGLVALGVLPVVASKLRKGRKDAQVA